MRIDLPIEIIHALVDAAVDAGLASTIRRRILMHKIDVAIVSSIPEDPSPRMQVFHDLITLEAFPVAFKQWLGNAIFAVPRGHQSRHVFEETLLLCDS